MSDAHLFLQMTRESLLRRSQRQKTGPGSAGEGTAPAVHLGGEQGRGGAGMLPMGRACWDLFIFISLTKNKVSISGSQNYIFKIFLFFLTLYHIFSNNWNLLFNNSLRKKIHVYMCSSVPHLQSPVTHGHLCFRNIQWKVPETNSS